jgi:hypothetical protein
LAAQRARFVELSEQHIDALKHGNIPLAHELLSQVHELLIRIDQDVASGASDISHRIFASVRNRYINTPEPGLDPEYDAASDEVGRLMNETVSRSRALRYPGSAPVGAPAAAARAVFAEKDSRKGRASIHSEGK